MRRASHSLALLLVELVDEGHLRHLGYASLNEYASTVLDLTPREARALYRLGTAFPEMPALAAAMEAGALDWTKARELLRVITPDTEAEWVARAQARSSRELEREVSATPFGAPPPAAGTPIVPGSQRGRLILEGERSDIDTIRRAIAVQRARCGLDAEELDDCALLALLALANIRLAEQAEVAFEAGMGDGVSGAETGEDAFAAETDGVVSGAEAGEDDETVCTAENAGAVSETGAAKAVFDAGRDGGVPEAEAARAADAARTAVAVEDARAVGEDTAAAVAPG